MAQRRMFSLRIVDCDMLLDLPLSAQALYFHLGMRADDEGFVDGVRRIKRMIGASDEDLDILFRQCLLISFPSGVCAIRHWRIHNSIQKDRFSPTCYAEERSQLELDSSGAYVERTDEAETPCIQDAAEDASEGESAPSTVEPSCIQDVSNLEPPCIQPVSNPEPQVRLGKVSTGEDKSTSSRGRAREGETDDALSADIAAQRELTDFIQSSIDDMNSYAWSALDEFINDGLSTELVHAAVEEAVNRRVRNWSYVRTILNRWLREGIRTMDDVRRDLSKRAPGQSRASPRSAVKPGGHFREGVVPFSDRVELKDGKVLPKVKKTREG